MSEYILIFRMDLITPEKQPTPEQMKGYMVQWNEWVNGIATNNKLAGGNHLSAEGKVIKQNSQVTDGPYAFSGQSVAGYLIIRANDLDEALVTASACPILNGESNSVEVREIGMTDQGT